MAHTQVYACRTGAPPAPAVNADDDYDYDDEGKGKVKGPAEAKFDATAVQASAVPTAAYHGIDVTEAMKERLNEGFERQGISIHDISIMDVQLPHLIAQQMTNRTLVRSKQTYEKMEQKFLMQTIRLQNEVAQMKLDETEKQEKARTVGGKDTQSLRDGLNEKRAAYDRISAEFQEQTRADVSKIKARTQEMSGELDFKRERLLETLALEAQETATLTVARIEAHVEALVAETRAAVATLQGEAQTKLAAAEEAADALLSMARSLDLVEKRLDVYEALAANMDVVVSDSSDGEYNKLLLSDAVLRTHLEGANLTEAQLVAKLNVLRLASNAFGLRNEWTNR
mmetsp:Transcript_17332/g.61612  ORF Transcript_17332/g.61612 Transcript_17332/m.61612 type:complete len:341 (+) Transcript_17332:473-1495(+)